MSTWNVFRSISTAEGSSNSPPSSVKARLQRDFQRASQEKSTSLRQRLALGERVRLAVTYTFFFLPVANHPRQSLARRKARRFPPKPTPCHTTPLALPH